MNGIRYRFLYIFKVAVFIVICTCIVASSFSVALPSQLTTKTSNSDRNALSSGRSSSRIIYVDDDNVDGPWYGTLDHPFFWLFDAIDVADEGDTIFVFSGTYWMVYTGSHHLILEKQGMKLIGEDKDSTVLVVYGFSGLELMTITADNIEFRGFTIRTDRIPDFFEPPMGWSAVIAVYSDKNTIKDINILHDYYFHPECGYSGVGQHGILLSGASDNIISDNNLPQWIQYAGICIKSQSNRNIISQNIIENDGYIDPETPFWQENGIRIEDSSDNIIFGNEISCSSSLYRCIYAGITLDNAHNNTLVRNNIRLSSLFNTGIQLDYSPNNCIIANNLRLNYLGIQLYDSQENTVVRNRIVNSLVSGFQCIENSNDNLIYHNNFVDNFDEIAWDVGTNNWDNEYPSGGNYWSDFDEPDEGAWDNNSDGIVDDPYDIPGGDNQDHYPYIDENGWPNTSPYTPSDPNPKNEEMGVDANIALTWIGGDPEEDDFVFYDVYFGKTNPPPLVCDNYPTTTYNPGVLEKWTSYYWKVVAQDTLDLETEGPVWEFTTGESELPWVSISKPENAIYVFNNKKSQCFIPVIIGKVDIEVDTLDCISGVNRVEFYIDDELKSTDTEEPYTWMWNEKTPLQFRHTIKVVIYDNAENVMYEELRVVKFW